MAEQRKVAGIPVNVFVKGGTTTQKWDEEKKRFYAETDRRQAHQDGQRAAVASAAGRPDTKSALLSLQLTGAGNPKVCLTYKARDHALERQAICEVAVLSATEMILVIVCPQCLQRTQRQADSQLVIKNQHREFWLDGTRAALWVDPASGMTHRLAGTITTRDLLSCNALGCTWKFRIEDSMLYGSDQFNM